MNALSKDTLSWSFTDRGFLFAALVSVLWHLFWFFSVTIVVTPKPVKNAVNTRVVSLGPVLDDALIRTLIEARPEYSQTFYRELSDFEPAIELPEQTIERRGSGNVTSLPFSERSAQSLRRLMSGDKASPEELLGASGFSPSAYFELEGDVTADRILSRPDPPNVNDVREVKIEFGVDSAGKVTSTEIVGSSGDAALDRRWEDHLRQWLFLPSPVLGGSDRRTGRVTFKRSTVG